MNDTDLIRCWREANDGIQTRLYYIITSAEWNCAEHYGKCDSCPMSQSDPDIAGIGVIIAFMSSVFITASLSIAFSILATVQPRKRPDTPDTSSTTAKAYACVGEIVTKILGGKHAVRCAKICYDMIICLGDQQLVGSVALLVAATKKLHLDKTLSVYHFELALGMVFLSSTAFTFSMICYYLRHQWIEDDGCTRRRRHQQHGPHPWYRRVTEGLPWAIRIFFRLSLVALLLYNISVAARMKDLPWDCPAICYKNSRGYDWRSVGLHPIIMLLFAIQFSITDCILLTLAHNWWDPKAFLALMSNQIRSLWTSYQDQDPSGQDRQHSISLPDPSLRQGCFDILNGLIVVLWLSETDLFCSLPMVTGWFVSLVIITLYAWRRTHIHVPESLRRLGEETQEEMQMGFGQIMAVILLVLLVFQLAISISVHYAEDDGPTPDVETDGLIRHNNVNVDNITVDTSQVVIIVEPTETSSVV